MHPAKRSARAPEMAMAHNNLGLCLAAQGQLPEAIASYREALKLNPRYVEALINLGNALREQGERGEALAALRAGRAAGSAPGGCALQPRLCAVRIAPDRRGDREFPERAVRAAQLSCSHTWALRRAQRVQGLFAEAQASCEAALAIAPENPRALQLLGELHADRGEFAQAHELWQRTIARHPRFADRLRQHRPTGA